ncbi:MAG: hypothetical protein GTN99_07695, partial [Candidatus Dadabacteria bacterium]|nr:hypothetical protein [Candidatus Dadabacteria bacterium]NIT14107.1 hypothetical protein [Candidatus Dadabacteria bacterium]
GYRVYKVSSFTEKPGLGAAKRYIRSGNYFWNSGIFIWKASSILSEFGYHCPQWDKYSGYNFNDKAQLNKYYNEVKPGPVDKMIMEKSKNTVVIPVDFEWSDIGTWQSLDEYLRKGKAQNIIRGDVYSLDTKSSLIIGTKPVITIGVKDMVIVDSNEGLLVINKNSSQHLKQLIQKLSN